MQQYRIMHSCMHAVEVYHARNSFIVYDTYKQQTSINLWMTIIAITGDPVLSVAWWFWLLIKGKTPQLTTQIKQQY